MYMKTEIERKFLVDVLPNLEEIEKVSYERYFLFNDVHREIRIQRKWVKYEFERKIKENTLSAEKQKFEISKDEFDRLKESCIGFIIRDSYNISRNPDISLKTYHGNLEWFQRIEVEFESIKQADEFVIPDWFGKEISGKIWARDSEISQMSFYELKKIL